MNNTVVPGDLVVYTKNTYLYKSSRMNIPSDDIAYLSMPCGRTFIVLATTHFMALIMGVNDNTTICGWVYSDELSNV